MLTYPLGDGAELGSLEPWHAEQYLKTIDRCREHLKAEILSPHTVFTVDDARQLLQSIADAHAADDQHLYGMWLAGELVGVVRLFNFDTGMRTCEIGVWVAPEFQGRGLVTKACRAVIAWAFQVRGMARVQWRNSTTNVRSSAVARRLGMTMEGLLRSSWEVGGVRKDNEVWSVLADEWPTAA